jgi:hypothetical protein
MATRALTAPEKYISVHAPVTERSEAEVPSQLDLKVLQMLQETLELAKATSQCAGDLSKSLIRFPNRNFSFSYRISEDNNLVLQFIENANSHDNPQRIYEYQIPEGEDAQPLTCRVITQPQQGSNGSGPTELRVIEQDIMLDCLYVKDGEIVTRNTTLDELWYAYHTHGANPFGNYPFKGT